jgi:hypothetical protein
MKGSIILWRRSRAHRLLLSVSMAGDRIGDVVEEKEEVLGRRQCVVNR